MSVSSLALAQTTLAASGFDYALQQPLFPGKILLWILFMLSLLSWAVMLSKAISFYRMRRADREFNRQFRTARQPMQLFERNYSDELSMQWLVYEHGAHEAAFQMLGSPDRDATFATRMRSADGMAPTQMKAVRDAFDRGEDAAAARIRLGLPILSMAAAGAPFLGLLGLVWILMRTFSDSSAAGGLSAVSPGIAGGLAVMVVALLVATPAIFGQIMIAAHGRERLRQLGGFKDEALRLMERFYVSGAEMPEAESGTEQIQSEVSSAMMGTAVVEDREEEAGEFEDPKPDVLGMIVDPSVSHLDDEPEFDAGLQIGDKNDSMESEEAEPGLVQSESIVVHHQIEKEDFVLPDVAIEADEMVQDEMPLSEIQSPFEAVEEGFLESGDDEDFDSEDSESGRRRGQYETPFSEPEINPIAAQTAGILAGGTA